MADMSNVFALDFRVFTMKNTLTFILIYYIIGVALYTLSYFRHSTEESKLTMFDVGQGDALLVETYDVAGQSFNSILIDGGPDYSLDYALYRRHIWNPLKFATFCPDIFVLTHEHADHYVGLLRFYKRCPYKKLITFNDISQTSLKLLGFSPNFQDNIKNNSLNLSLGDSISSNNIQLDFLWPPHDFTSTDLNALSYVNLLQIRTANSWITLLTSGDVPSWALLRALELWESSGKNTALLTKVFKTSHHGSQTGLDEALLEHMYPEKCLISVGVNNSFGHPHKKVIEELSRWNCVIYRTDQLGTVELVFS